MRWPRRPRRPHQHWVKRSVRPLLATTSNWRQVIERCISSACWWFLPQIFLICLPTHHLHASSCQWALPPHPSQIVCASLLHRGSTELTARAPLRDKRVLLFTQGLVAVVPRLFQRRITLISFLSFVKRVLGPSHRLVICSRFLPLHVRVHRLGK